MTLREEVQTELIAVADKVMEFIRGNSDEIPSQVTDKATDAILSKFLERLPKEKRYLQGLTNSSALEEAGYDQAIRDVKEIMK